MVGIAAQPQTLQKPTLVNKYDIEDVKSEFVLMRTRLGASSGRGFLPSPESFFRPADRTSSAFALGGNGSASSSLSSTKPSLRNPNQG